MSTTETPNSDAYGQAPSGGYGLSLGDVHGAIVAAFQLSEDVDGTLVGPYWIDDTDPDRPGWFLLTDGKHYLSLEVDVTLSAIDELTGPSTQPTDQH